MTRACDNPFRAERVEALRYRSPGFTWQALLARLWEQGGRGALRGAEGRGKTTLLHELGERLAAAGYRVRRLRPDPDDRRLARRQVRGFAVGADERTALLLDGADRVGWLDWRLLVRAARGAGVLVVTTHREGRLPTLHRCATSSQLLGELIGELDASSVGASVGASLETETLELFARSAGNVRLALRELYDGAARRRGAAKGRTSIAASG